MSTLRIHGIEAKSDPTSASVNEKIKITNSNGDLLLHLDSTSFTGGNIWGVNRYPALDDYRGSSSITAYEVSG